MDETFKEILIFINRNKFLLITPFSLPIAILLSKLLKKIQNKLIESKRTIYPYRVKVIKKMNYFFFLLIIVHLSKSLKVIY